MNSFEQATLEQLVSYRARTDADIDKLMNSKRLQREAIELCERINEQREEMGLKPIV